jgi:transcriptional regulator with GAF, ATPase, and Fis domain
LADHADVQQTLNRIVHLAVETLDVCDFTDITIVERGKVISPASSDDVPRLLDAIQGEVGEGPCLDAIKEHEVFQTRDLADEERWPTFAVRAHQETGVRSILSLRLFIEEETMGALNLYATSVDAFDETDVALGSVFAVHAAVAMLASRREEDLERKAASRDLIGRAKGILMARENDSDEQAFYMLRRASQRLNVKLTTLAEQVNVSGETPSS